MNDQERTWCANAIHRGGSFVHALGTACLQADDSNFIILRPALREIMEKYPKYSEE